MGGDNGVLKRTEGKKIVQDITGSVSLKDVHNIFLFFNWFFHSSPFEGGGIVSVNSRLWRYS